MWSHIIRRPCGALQNLEEFNRKVSVRSMAGRRAAIMRAPHGEQVRHAGTVLVPYGNNVGTMWEQFAVSGVVRE